MLRAPALQGVSSTHKKSRGQMEDQASSHNFLSVIFGILGIFLIRICGRKKTFVEHFLIEKNLAKKSENIFRGQKIFEKCSLKKSMKIENFEISKKIQKKIEILKF